MSDPRYHGTTYVGAPLTRQQALNKRHQQFFDNHPTSYGWTVLRVNKQHNKPVYTKDGVELMRHPSAPAWLVQYMGECYRQEMHISELTEKLSAIKFQIEWNVTQKETAATIEKLAA